MPTITNKNNLGSLFGGKIASINYNFQTASEPSTATITVVSENNTFITPEFGDQISIPPFGIQMIVTERGKRKDTNYDTLQVELVESISEVLDKELVLIYGEHTDLERNLNNELYPINNSSFIPKQYYPNEITFNGLVKFPSLDENYIQNFGNGINVIGSARATYIENPSQNLTGNSTFSNEAFWITFGGGEIKRSISNYESIESFVYSPEKAGSTSVAFGYTLKNLRNLFYSKGLSFEGSSASIMLDENIFFSESGTMREVLASVLSKIGRSFYIDPFTQKINIISNADIAQINNNLLSKFSNFTSTSGATQISLKESVVDVDAAHFVLKGDLNYYESDKSNNNGANTGGVRAKKQKLYKFNVEALTGDLKHGDIELFKRVAPALYALEDEGTVDRYIFALGLKYGSENWGSLYGAKEYTPGEFSPKVTTNPYQVLRNPPQEPPWQQEIKLKSTVKPYSNVYYDFSRTIGARQLIRDGEIGPSLFASETSYYKYVRAFAELWAGTYFSAPMSLRSIERRSYQPEAKWIGGLNNTFQLTPVKGDAMIGEVDALRFLFTLLERIGAKTTYTVAEVAKKAYKSSDNPPVLRGSDIGTNQSDGSAIGSGDYFIIGTRQLFSGSPDLRPDDLKRRINKNFWDYYSAGSESKWLLYTANALNEISYVEEKMLESFEKETKKVKDKLLVRYTPSEPAEDPKDEDNQENITDTPNFFSIKSINSNTRNFARRSLVVVQNRFAEMKLFLQNIGDLNPQFSGPLISTQIEYFRPPLKSDFDIKNGVDSVSVSISESGVSTSVSYSSRKFAQIDLSVLRDFLGGNTTGFFKNLRLPAFRKNNLRR
ncbi:MAG: hypothetical protein KBD76_16120 [Bacteriovorax sp.]|nr:hypothetical protein [Bacteriovorax sp.]